MNPRIANWQGKRVWLLGASSGIGAAVASELHARGARLALTARRADKLDALALAGALLLPGDATSADFLAGARRRLLETMSGIDLVIYLAGDYLPMRAAQLDPEQIERAMAVNLMGAVRLTAAVQHDLRPGGGIAFVASVAGYRGLPRALCYGPGKAALIHFAECLHLDLAPGGVGVWVINPGFVATRLTARNDFSMPALLTPVQAARMLVDGLAKGTFEIHFPKRFTWLMKVLAHLPYAWYFRLIRQRTGN